MKDYLTTLQVANRLDRTPARIVQLILDGSLLAEKSGRDYFIKISTLDTFKLKKPTGRPPKVRKKE
jgi:hypothetical protein